MTRVTLRVTRSEHGPTPTDAADSAYRHDVERIGCQVNRGSAARLDELPRVRLWRPYHLATDEVLPPQPFNV